MRNTSRVRQGASQIPMLAAAGGLNVAAGLGWATVFGVRPVVVPVVVAGLVPVAVAALLRLTGWALTWRVFASLALFLVVGAAIAERRPPTPDAIGAVLTGCRDGPKLILSIILPAEARDAPLSTALAAVWLASLTTAELALHTRRVLLPLLPPLLAFTLGLGLGAGGDTLPGWIPAVLTAAAGIWLLVRAGVVLRFGAGRWAAGALTIGAAAVVAVAVGPHVPGADARDRYDPRELTEPPLDFRPETNALARLTGQVNRKLFDGEVELFTVRTDREMTAPWRVVVLDSFDGRQWSTASDFHRIGARVPPPPTDLPTDRVRQDVTLTGFERLESWFLPAAARPVSVSLAGLAANEDGVLQVPAGTDRPTRYTVVSEVARVASTEVKAAAPIQSDPSGLPVIEGPIKQTLDLLTRDLGTAVGELAALQNYFLNPVNEFVYDNGPDAPSGNGVHAVETLLTTRQGTAEQFASAFALMASAKGYHARVVFGYVPSSYDDATRTYTVTTDGAHAWPEVEFEGLGWVPFEPSPVDRKTVRDPEEDDEDIVQVPTPVPEGSELPEDPGPVDQPGPEAEEDTTNWVGRVVLVVAAVLAAAVFVVVGLVLAKVIRRRRRQQGTPAQRVAGAWREAVDRLVESGVKVSSDLAAGEVAAAPAVPASAAPPLTELAAVANRVRFAGGETVEDDAQVAWDASTRVRDGVRTGRSVFQRGRMAVDPRPLARR